VETDDENISTGLGFIDSIKPGIIQGSNHSAHFGELMTRLSTRQGVAGVLIDGNTYDTLYTSLDTNPTVRLFGVTPVDIKGRGRVKAVDVPISVRTSKDDTARITVNPGDYCFADNDGAAIVADANVEAVVREVKKKVAAEVDIKRRIDTGESIRQILNFHSAF
jgi:4-hydroxy-4-methyl-2-oxoglutarate aldolase